MQKFYFTFFLVLVISIGNAQPVICGHAQSFQFEIGNAIAATSDGGCIIAGLTAQYGISPQGEAYLLKLDSNHNVQWGKTIGNSIKSFFNDVTQTLDGGYIAAGVYESQTNIPHLLIVKTDSAGNEQWHQTMGSIGNDNAYVVKQTPDSGYVIVGHTFTSYLWTIKLSPQGAIEWVRKITGGGGKLGLGAAVAPDSGIVVCGYNSGTNSIADGNALVSKFDKDGNLLWSKAFGGIMPELFHTIENSLSGGYILGGYTADTTIAPGYVMMLAKVDDNGNLLWSKCMGGQYDDRIQSITKTQDGNYFASAYSVVDTVGIDTYHDVIFKFDDQGTVLWMKKRSYSTGDICNNIKETRSGQLIHTGNFYADISLTVTDSLGNSCCFTDFTLPQYPLTLPEMTVGVVDSGYTTYTQTLTQSSGGIFVTDCITVGVPEKEKRAMEIIIAPNPVTTYFKISNFNFHSSDQLILSDMLGKPVLTKIITAPTSNLQLQTSNLSSGMYLLTLKTKTGITTRKIIKEN